jgi:aminoglycoside phosphotransferase family enzyme
MDQHEIEAMKKQFPNAQLIQTHVSWLFFIGQFVYKIKKPVKFSFLDYSTLKKRKFYCEEEVRLNKRLSPEIYLCVVPITESEGKYLFGGKGKIIDYAVKMVALPQDKKMDNLLREGKITSGHIVALAKIIVNFHRRIKTIKQKEYCSPELVQKQIDDLAGVKDIVENVCGVSVSRKIDVILKKCKGFISKNADLMKKRQRDGRIKDCHGDLHSANIFLVDEKFYIFDCIEFNKFFRYIDVASEVAFMAMDLDAFGREDLSSLFVDEYVRLSKDNELLTLLNLYKCYRANVRAKVAALAIAQGGEEGNKENIMKYLLLAERYAKEL